MEAYRSGHNGLDSKSSNPVKGTVGSNPTASATSEQAIQSLLRFFFKNRSAPATPLLLFRKGPPSHCLPGRACPLGAGAPRWPWLTGSAANVLPSARGIFCAGRSAMALAHRSSRKRSPLGTQHLLCRPLRGFRRGVRAGAGREGKQEQRAACGRPFTLKNTGGAGGKFSAAFKRSAAAKPF